MPKYRYDENDFRFDRPKGNSRPRTKRRPDFSAAQTGMVITVDRGRYTVLLNNDSTEVLAVKARQLGRKGVIIGDQVRIVGDLSGTEGTLGRIVEVLERKSVLRRTADDNDPFERPIVANATQLLIVTALADPPPRIGMIDRIIVAALEAGIRPILCLTKSDLASPDELIAAYQNIDLPIVVTEIGGDISLLKKLLIAQTTVFVGHSGVGKSTLINALIPDANRQTGQVNAVTGRGRHTSTSAIALRLPNHQGWVIDTPGVRSFGLHHAQLSDIVKAFPDLLPYAQDCPRGCQHSSTAPDCGFDKALALGKISELRLNSFRRMEKAWLE